MRLTRPPPSSLIGTFSVPVWDEKTIDDWLAGAGRDQFEEEVFADYFARGIKFVENKQFAEIRNQKPQAELCQRDGEHYMDRDISCMWHGWKLAIKALQRKQ